MERLSATYFNNGHVLQFLEDIVSEYCPAIGIDIRRKKKEKNEEEGKFLFSFFYKKVLLTITTKTKCCSMCILVFSFVARNTFGIFTFFNGLCPDNIIFQGVACQVIKLELEKMPGGGFETDFYPMNVDCKDDSLWEGTPFRYYFRSDYHLPLCRRASK